MKEIRKVLAVLLMAAVLISALGLSASAESGEASDGSFAGRALEFVREQLPALLSGMTLLGVAVLAHAFKGSFLPILERGLGKLGGGVDTVTGEAKELLRQAKAESEQLRAELLALAEEMGKEKEGFLALNSLVSEMKEAAKGELSAVSKQNEAVLAMLKEVFTAARLPAASKLALEEMYQRSQREKNGGGE